VIVTPSFFVPAPRMVAFEATVLPEAGDDQIEVSRVNHLPRLANETLTFLSLLHSCDWHPFLKISFRGCWCSVLPFGVHFEHHPSHAWLLRSGSAINGAAREFGSCCLALFPWAVMDSRSVMDEARVHHDMLFPHIVNFPSYYPSFSHFPSCFFLPPPAHCDIDSGSIHS
jgi:hypothetical protein